jgi:hypothetical protein
MKKLLSLSLLALGLTVMSCQENVSSEKPGIEPMGANGNGGGTTTANANAVIVGTGSKVVSKNTYATIAVMDSTGNNRANVYTSSYGGSGEPDELMQFFGLTAANIKENVKKVLKRK